MALICENGGRECIGCMCCKAAADKPDCPECGRESCDFFYRKDGEIIGCEDCIKKVEAYG